MRSFCAGDAVRRSRFHGPPGRLRISPAALSCWPSVETERNFRRPGRGCACVEQCSWLRARNFRKAILESGTGSEAGWSMASDALATAVYTISFARGTAAARKWSRGEVRIAGIPHEARRKAPPRITVLGGLLFGHESRSPQKVSQRLKGPTVITTASPASLAPFCRARNGSRRCSRMSIDRHILLVLIARYVVGGAVSPPGREFSARWQSHYPLLIRAMFRRLRYSVGRHRNGHTSHAHSSERSNDTTSAPAASA